MNKYEKIGFNIFFSYIMIVVISLLSLVNTEFNIFLMGGYFGLMTLSMVTALMTASKK